MSYHRTITALVSLSLLALSACGAQVDPSSGDENANAVQSALDQENGGMTATPETVDAAQYADMPEMQTYSDTTSLPDKPDAKLYTVLVMWGHLPRYNGVDPSAFMDWSGSVQVTGGVVKLDRPVAFDKEDRILPRPDAHTIPFVSKTRPLTDGLLMHVLQTDPDGTLVIETKALRTEIKLADIGAQMYDHHNVDDANGMTFVAFQNRKGCADGFVIGRYRRMNAKVGRFHFLVTDDHGDRRGFVRGIYGYSQKQQANVFIGKYLSQNGEHRGFTVGKYGDHKFLGGWRVDVPGAKGLVSGLYWEGRDDRPGHGFAFGHWAEKCPAK